MRLIRIREFFDHRDLSNNIIQRSNVPFGGDLHWTRFYDFFLIIPSYVLSLFGFSIDKSVGYVGFIVSPIVKSVAAIVLLRVFQAIFSKRDAFLATALFVANFIISPFGSFGRPDHHIFIMLFMIIYLSNIARILGTGSSNLGNYIKAALTSALCIWISPETMIPLLLVDGILLLSAFSNVLKLEDLYVKNLFTTCIISAIICFPWPTNGYYIIMSLMFLVAPYVTFNKFYLTDPIFKYWHMIVLCLAMVLSPLFPAPEYDKISSAHMSLYLFMSLFLGINMFRQKEDLKNRATFAMVWGAIVASVFLCIYPKFFCGMSADISDYVKEIWLYRVSEMKSPLKCGDIAFWTTHFIVIVISIYSKILELLRKKFSRIDLLWWIFIANSLCYVIFGGFFYRMLPYSALFSLPLMVELGMNGKWARYLSRASRIIVTFFLSTLLILASGYLKDGDSAEEPFIAYEKTELYDELNKLSDEPVVIMADVNEGVDILYFTKHSAVGVPYHRQVWGIVASHKIMEDEYNEEEVKEILRKTNSSYIFVRKSNKKNVLKNMSLARIIIDKSEKKPNATPCPAWISLVNLPQKFNDVVLAKVNRELLQK
ncbi:MAG: hypothetical protein LBT63_01615 [Holosporaceae bacterium]|nr:hypothetical protein [Holosporaceae bacterium]